MRNCDTVFNIVSIMKANDHYDVMMFVILYLFIFGKPHSQISILRFVPSFIFPVIMFFSRFRLSVCFQIQFIYPLPYMRIPSSPLFSLLFLFSSP